MCGPRPPEGQTSSASSTHPLQEGYARQRLGRGMANSTLGLSLLVVAAFAVAGLAAARAEFFGALGGDYSFQKYAVEPGDYIRKDFFGPDPRLQEMVAHLTDDDLRRLRRGGHDYRKLYAAYRTANPIDATHPNGRDLAFFASTVTSASPPATTNRVFTIDANTGATVWKKNLKEQVGGKEPPRPHQQAGIDSKACGGGGGL